MKPTRWQYLAVPLNTNFTFYYDDKLHSPQSIDELGAQGWELVETHEKRQVVGEKSWSYVGVFKRRVE
jgi:hypothetical protein